jgi:tight adherence protein B
VVTTLIVLVFVSVTAALVGIQLFTVRGRQRQVLQRLDSIQMAQKRGDPTGELRLLRDELLSDVPLLHRMLSQWSWTGSLQRKISQAGMQIKPGKFLLLCGVLGFGVNVVLRLLSLNPWFAALFAGAAAAAPFIILGIKRNRRMHAFETQFPEAIDLLVRSARSGHSFSSALEMIATELSNPIAGEFRKTYEEQNLGLPLRDALVNLSERIPLIDVRFFVTALFIQKDTGGNLAEILENLARLIRERFKLYGEVRTKTAHGRLTATILIALPILVGALLWSANPKYMRLLIDDPLGPRLLAGAALMQFLGALIVRKIIRIEV